MKKGKGYGWALFFGLLIAAANIDWNKKNPNITDTHYYGIEKPDMSKDPSHYDWQARRWIYKSELKDTQLMKYKPTSDKSITIEDLLDEIRDEIDEDHREMLREEYGLEEDFWD